MQSSDRIDLRSSRVAVGFEALEPRTLMSFSMHINFQPGGAAVPAGYRTDTGGAYGLRSNGFTYGWSADNRANARDRNAANSPDQRYDTFNHMSRDGIKRNWQIKVPNGTYSVKLLAGDAINWDSVFRLN